MSHRAHGTNAKYQVEGCRCPECSQAKSKHNRARARSVEPAYVAAVAARAHVRDLSEAGVGLKQIAKTSGVSQGALWKLMYGKNGKPSKRIRRTTEQRILAVTPAAAAAGARIDATPTWVLIAEMVAAGAAKLEIAAAIGQTGPLQLGRETVTARNARAVAQLHEAWCAGTVTLGRRDCWGNYTVAQPPAPQRKTTADVSELYLELAEIVEARNEQAQWRNRAACRGRPAYLWFPGRGDNETSARGRTVCGWCPVRDECRAANFDQPDGTYGGLTATARLAIRDADATPLCAPRRPAARCGTNAGYASHHRQGDDPCEPCRLAHAHYVQDNRATRGKASA